MEFIGLEEPGFKKYTKPLIIGLLLGIRFTVSLDWIRRGGLNGYRWLNHVELGILFCSFDMH